MKIFQNIHLRNLFFSSLFFSFPFLSKAQETKKYQGDYKLLKYEGKASFDYKIVESDTILEGSFLFSKTDLDSLLSRKENSFNISGFFTNNQPNGAWRMSFGEFTSNYSSKLINYEYKISVNGVEETVSGNMNNGKPNGNWVFKVDEIKDSEFSKVLFQSDFTFQDGIPQQSFTIANDSTTLAGRFLRNGYAHDEWTIFENENAIGNSETWVFKSGVLQRIEVNTNTQKTYKYFSVDDKNLREVNLDSRYLKVIKLLQGIKNESFKNSKIELLLFKNESYYKKIDTIFSKLGDASFFPEFKVFLPAYPLSDSENENIESIENLFLKAKSISTKYIDNTQLSILKLSDDKAAFLYEVIKEVDTNYLQPLSTFLDFKNEGVLTFIPREKLIEYLWKSGKPSKKIKVNWSIEDTDKPRTFTLENHQNFDFSNNDVSTVLEIVKYASQSLEKIDANLSSKLLAQLKEEELIKLEEKLLEKNKNLSQLLDSTKQRITISQKEALIRLKELEKEQLAKYAQLKNFNEKLEEGKNLLSCYEVYQKLANSIQELEKNKETIKKEYTQKIWNPFTATLMDEQVKKRILNTFDDVLLPFFLGEINKKLSCEQAKNLDALIENTYQKILEIRNLNTRKLERKLKRTKQPKEVLELMGVTGVNKYINEK